MFVDADHAHDKITGRSITGLVVFVCSTPVVWYSKKQQAVATSTFSAEFTALKAAVEECVNLRYHLRSMGIPVKTATPIYVDNMGVVLNATNLSSSLNKKTVALSYHFVREPVANRVIHIRKIDTKDNYADSYTKALLRQEHHSFYYQYQRNG